MKNIKINELLKLIVIILLLISFSDMSFGYYKLMKYVLMSIFVWFLISEADLTKKGWSFLFFVLAVLFNPFFEVEIGENLWKVVDIITIFIIIINIVEILKESYNFTLTVFLKRILLGIVLLSGIFLLYKLSGPSAEEIAKLEAQQQADSIAAATRAADSLATVEGTVYTPNEDKWIYLTSSNDGTQYYFNPIYSSESYGIIKTWIKMEVEKGKLENYRLKKYKKQKKYAKFSNSMLLYEFDCKNKTLRVKKFTDYDFNGDVIESNESDDIWDDVLPNSIGEAMLNGVCSNFNY